MCSMCRGITEGPAVICNMLSVDTQRVNLKVTFYRPIYQPKRIIVCLLPRWYLLHFNVPNHPPKALAFAQMTPYVIVCTHSLCPFTLPKSQTRRAQWLRGRALDSRLRGYVYEQPSRINCSIWLDASQRN